MAAKQCESLDEHNDSTDTSVLPNVAISPTKDNKLPYPIAPGNYTSLRVDLPSSSLSSSSFKSLERVIYPDLFKDIFFCNRHYNFIGTENSETKEHVVISVLADPIDNKQFPPTYRALRTTKKGYQQFSIKITDDDSSIPLLDKIENALTELEHGKEISAVSNNAEFSSKFVKLEESHPQNRKNMKVGIIYCRKNQNLPSQMFLNGTGNDKCSEEFWNFIKTMGKKLILSTWDGYRGDMGSQDETFYTLWNGVDVIYHVAPLLDSEGHRRLIGNDVAVIFFLESSHRKDVSDGKSDSEETLLDLSQIDQLGSMPQIFAVVQPDKIPGNYRLGFFCNKNIKWYGPELPKDFDSISDPQALKDFLLTKIYNGLVMTNYCPPINRLFYVPRGGTIEAIVAQFPTESKKVRRQKEKQRREADRRNLQGQKLVVRVISGRNLTHELGEISEGISARLPHSSLSISILGQKEETKIIRATQHPVWNALFLFALAGLDPIYDDLEMVCMHNHTHFMGEIKFSIKEALDKRNKLHWVNLKPRSPHDPLSSGEILLFFTVISDGEELDPVMPTTNTDTIFTNTVSPTKSFDMSPTVSSRQGRIARSVSAPRVRQVSPVEIPPHVQNERSVANSGVGTPNSNSNRTSTSNNQSITSNTVGNTSNNTNNNNNNNNNNSGTVSTNSTKKSKNNDKPSLKFDRSLFNRKSTTITLPLNQPQPQVSQLMSSSSSSDEDD